MIFNIDIIKKFYSTLDQKVSQVKKHIDRPLTLTEKILYRWGFPKPIIDKVVLLVEHHLFDASPTAEQRIQEQKLRTA